MQYTVSPSNYRGIYSIHPVNANLITFCHNKYHCFCHIPWHCSKHHVIHVIGSSQYRTVCAKRHVRTSKLRALPFLMDPSTLYHWKSCSTLVVAPLNHHCQDLQTHHPFCIAFRHHYQPHFYAVWMLVYLALLFTNSFFLFQFAV